MMNQLANNAYKSHPPESYRAIEFWGRRLGSRSYYIAAEQEMACLMRAPLLAIYREHATGKWRTLLDVTNPDVIRAALAEGLITLDTLIESYTKGLAAHDWSHEFSDDDDVYHRGNEEHRRLLMLARFVDAKGDLWRKHYPAGCGAINFTPA